MSINIIACTKCKTEYPATPEFFPPDKHKRNGLKSCCRVCSRSSCRKWHRTNRRRFRRYLQDNQENIRESKRKWEKLNITRRQFIRAKRRAHKLNQTPQLTEKERKKIELYYKISQYLGESWQVDHIIPLSKGGLHHPDNLQITTKNFNLRKQDKTDFREPNMTEVFRI